MADQTSIAGAAEQPLRRRRSDQELMDLAMLQLRRTGCLEYAGEFGPEITTFIPFVNWLKEEGYLKDRQVSSYRGMKPYYFFLDEGQLVERQNKRGWVPAWERNWPTNSTYTATLQPWHRPPDFRAHYAPRARRFTLPTLFIQNKFTVEWSEGPINYVPLRQLERLLEIARDRFQVIYSRPGGVASPADYSDDLNLFCHYPDLEVVKRFPEAIVLEDLVKAEGRAYNELKLEILAGCHLFFAVQGGGAHILAAFGNSVLAIIHRQGAEYPHAYQGGPYSYLSNPAPRRIIARTTEEIDAVLKIFETVRVENGRAEMAAPLAAQYQ